MKTRIALTTTVLLFLLSGFTAPHGEWLTKKKKDFMFFFKTEDKNNVNEYNSLVKKGIESVNVFTGSSFKNSFQVYIHPNRASLDMQWQKDWGMPDFKSECWMVASGIAIKLDMISPKQWSKEACEHTYDDKIKTQQLVTHELFHVYHGQVNVSPDFSNTEGIDWFVEGFATYASGQCDTGRLQEVKKAIEENKIPASLDKFWSGKLRYGLSGSVVKFIDEKYGRQKLLALLPFNKKSDVLAALNTTEETLMTDWKSYISAMKQG